MPMIDQPLRTAEDTSTDDAGSLGARTLTKNLLSDHQLRRNMGKGLRALFMEPVREPLPQDMVNALKKLDQEQK